MRTSRFQQILLYLMLCTINLLFVAKYAPRYGYPLWGSLAVYAALFAVVVWIGRRAWFGQLFCAPLLYAAALIVAAAGLVFLMFQFDPAGLRSGRLPAVEDWLGRLLHGEFPYGSDRHASGFPFLFFLVLPFYALGDAGWWQIASFLLFGWVVYHERASTAASGMILLLISPAFLYEVVVRSELFSNMVAVIVFLCWFDWRHQRDSTKSPFFWGLLGGLLLSTRGMVVLIYAVYFTRVFRHDISAGLRFFVGLVLAFAATILPFIMWNQQGFMHDGPFAIQSSYLSTTWIVILIAISFVYGLMLRSRTSAHGAIAIVLCTAVAIPFITSLAGAGWTASIWQDKFDISYFCFGIPFMILAIDRKQWSQTIY